MFVSPEQRFVASLCFLLVSLDLAAFVGCSRAGTGSLDVGCGVCAREKLRLGPYYSPESRRRSPKQQSTRSRTSWCVLIRRMNRF